MTKLKSIEQVKEAIKKVADTKPYAVGDIYLLDDRTYKVVEVLNEGQYHLKNTEEPFNSFLTQEYFS